MATSSRHRSIRRRPAVESPVDVVEERALVSRTEECDERTSGASLDGVALTAPNGARTIMMILYVRSGLQLQTNYSILPVRTSVRIFRLPG
jgi:hypothetical protein